MKKLRHTDMPEQAMLTTLAENITAALIRADDMYDEDPSIDYVDCMEIVVNGVSHEFILGGPQCAGLHAFIRRIWQENVEPSAEATVQAERLLRKERRKKLKLVKRDG